MGQYTHQERGLNRIMVNKPSTVEVSITLQKPKANCATPSENTRKVFQSIRKNMAKKEGQEPIPEPPGKINVLRKEVFPKSVNGFIL